MYYLGMIFILYLTIMAIYKIICALAARKFYAQVDASNSDKMIISLFSSILLFFGLLYSCRFTMGTFPSISMIALFIFYLNLHVLLIFSYRIFQSQKSNIKMKVIDFKNHFTVFDNALMALSGFIHWRIILFVLYESWEKKGALRTHHNSYGPCEKCRSYDCYLIEDEDTLVTCQQCNHQQAFTLKNRK
jgi:hypothetical protein